MSEASTPKTMFERLDAKRTLLLARCEQYAAWTIPSKFPVRGTDDNYEMAIDFQSHGAKCVNNLQNKIMLALFAPSRPFFRPELSPEHIAELKENGLQGAALDAVLSQVAKQGMKVLERMQARSVLVEVIAQLIITGNALLRDNNGAGDNLTMYTLRAYVVKRNVAGKIIQIILRETSELEAMPDAVQQEYRRGKGAVKPELVVSLYTELRWHSAKAVWVQRQFLDDVNVTHGVTQYKEKDCPFRVLTWSLAPGRNYGTGMVEEAQGAFHGLSTLSSAEIPGLLEMCRIIHLADPTGSTDAVEFQDALSGSVLVGREGDITTPDLGGKARDYASVAAKIEKYERILSEMFLLATGAVRSAERVTAEEIRLLANELETSVGGVYSRLSHDLQQWLAELAIRRNQDAQLRSLDVYVITGLDALSANGDLDNLRALMADLAATKDMPDEIKGTIIWDAYVQLLSSLHNVDYFKFLKSQEVANQERQADQDAAMAQQQELTATDALGKAAATQLSQTE